MDERGMHWGTSRPVGEGTPSVPASGSRRAVGLPGWLAGLVVVCCGATGCGETTRQYAPDLYRYFHPPESLKVLKDPNSTGDDRRYALKTLNEPLAHGGTAEQQQLVLDILKYSALHDPQAVCRMAAYETLRQFKDPRAVEILKEAYYKTTSYAPETGTVLRCQVLEALGETHNPGAVDLLVRVLREPPNSGTEGDKQQQLDERNAAARALSHYSDYQATNALVDVLRKEQDVALRTEAHQALVVSTGRDLPADAQAWSDLLNSANGKPIPYQEPSIKDRLYKLAGWNQDSGSQTQPQLATTPAQTPAPTPQTQPQLQPQPNVSPQPTNWPAPQPRVPAR